MVSSKRNYFSVLIKINSMSNIYTAVAKSCFIYSTGQKFEYNQEEKVLFVCILNNKTTYALGYGLDILSKLISLYMKVHSFKYNAYM